MKSLSFSVQFSFGAALALLTLGLCNGHATSVTPLQTAGAAQSSPFQQVRWEEAKIDQLRHAYHLLEHADGDYGGHRAEAMRSIKKAAEILGAELTWKGHAEESQWKSDRRLREAKSLLRNLVDETHGKEQAHIERAMKEIDKALSLK